jgi:3-dehydroquinate synthase
MSHSEHGFSVPFRFPVFFTRDAFNRDNRVFLDAIRRLEPDRCHRVLLALDSHVATAHPALVEDINEYFEAFNTAVTLVAPPVIVPGGEAVKNDLTHPFLFLKHINDVGLDRQSFVVVVGGGAVLDMVSFAAAIAHRSIRVVRLPTTVLSQADSGVAVKNGVNLFGKKNFVGTFVPPFAVINDARFLATLDRRDRISGVVEAVKVALLRDPAFYRYLDACVVQIATGDPDVLEKLVQRSAELHLAHICGNGDPFELGSARPLDFGHWAAHKLESMTGNRLRHGEAVAIGMGLDLMYAVRKGFLARSRADEIMNLLDGIGLPLWDDALVESDVSGGSVLIQGLREFREHLGGQPFEVTEMDESVVMEAIDELARRVTSVRQRSRSSVDSGVR